MGKKKGGKKKGKKSGGGGGGKKAAKGGGEDEMTIQEAILAFQIQVKEKAVEDLLYEIKGLQEKNKRHQARNLRLKEEQEIHIKVLLRQSKEQEIEIGQKEVFSCGDVEEAMKSMWQCGRTEEQHLEDLKNKIIETEKEYENVLAQVQMWREYRDVGANNHAMQIKLLESELEDMQKNFNDVCDHLKRQLEVAKSEIKTHMDECMAEQQYLASEKAMMQLDKAGVQEVHENEWLKREAAIHRKEVASIRSIVEQLEKENIEIISDLLDCQAEDLKIARNFQESQFEGEDELDQMDRQAMSIYQPGYQTPTGSTTQAITSGRERPRSAMQAAVEDRVFSLPVTCYEQGESDEDVSDDDDESYILEQQEYLHLGPLELKLLCARGEKKIIHPIDEGIQIVDGTSAEVTVTRPKWPVSSPMIRSAVKSAEVL